MPEAVIVSTARSPIGRAGKGSLKDTRADDLSAQMVRAALAKVPELDPADLTDLLLVCGLPGGEQGANMGRRVSVLLGYDRVAGLLGLAGFPEDQVVLWVSVLDSYALGAALDLAAPDEVWRTGNGDTPALDAALRVAPQGRALGRPPFPHRRRRSGSSRS